MFSFCGCGWKAINTTNWSKDQRDWILAIDDLFTKVFGEDFLRYVYDKDKGTSVDDHILSTLIDYNHDQWESLYLKQQTAAPHDTPAKPKHPTSRKGPKRLFLGSKGSPKGKAILLADEDDSDEDIHVLVSPSDGSEQQKSSVTFTASTQADIVPQVAAIAQQDTPVISHNPKHSPHKARTRISFIENETSQEKVILLDDDDTDEEINPSDGTEKQLSSAISSASTRAELAALATLIPPVSPAGAFLNILPGQVADSDSVFTNPFSIVQRPCRAVIERAETLLIDERKGWIRCCYSRARQVL